MTSNRFRAVLLAAAIIAVVYSLSLAWSSSERARAAADQPQPSSGPAAAQNIASNMQLFGTKGKEVVLQPGRELTLFEQAGAGTLTHMWFGGSWTGWGDTRIRVYVDGERRPGIDMAIFMGHGIGFGDETAPWGTNRIGKTGHPSGVYDTYKIPFSNGVRVAAELSPETRRPQTFWWYVRGVTKYTTFVGPIELPPAARLRLHRREDYQAKPLEEVDLLNAKGSGMVYAVMLAAESPTNFNYLESCMRFYPGGRKDPIFLSSGTEDYFLGTYYFNAGLYHLPPAGLTHIDPDRPDSRHRFSAYRFHEDDPLPFQNGVRLTWRIGEELGGRRFGDPQPTKLTSYVWAYEW